MLSLVLAATLFITAGPGQQDPGSAVPARHVEGAVHAEDYPAAAIHAEEEGLATTVLSISANGNVTDCRIAASSGSPSLDAISCMIPLQRFRFEPARDARGRRAASNFSQTIRWTIPTYLPVVDRTATRPVYGFGEVRHVLASNRNGVVCAIEKSGEAFSAEPATGYCESQAHDLARLARQPIAMMIVTRIVPEGTSPPPRRPIQGTYLAGSASDFEVAANGHITSCVDVPPTGNERQPFSPLCQTRLRPGLVFEPDAEGRTQRGRYSIELYRLGTPTR